MAKKAKKPRTKLTMKQKEFVKQVVITKNPAKAAVIAYELGSKGGSKSRLDKQLTASSIGIENLEKPLIKKSIMELMDKMGMSDEELATIHKELLQSVDERVRLAAMIEAYRLKDKYPSQKVKLGRLEELEDVFIEDELKSDDIETKDKVKDKADAKP